MSNELPKGWAEAALYEISSKLVDGSHIPPPKANSGKPMLSARNVLNGQIIFDGFRFIDSDAFEFEDGRTGVRPGDVLVTIVGTIGRSAVVPEGTEPFVLQRSVAVLRPIGFSPRLLMYLLQAPQTQKELQRLSRGTAQKGVYLKSLAQVGLRIPPLKEGERIVAEIEKQFTRLEAAVAALRRVQANLKRYRAALLKAAIQGRLVPTEAEFARHEGRSYEPASELLKRILAERRPRWEADQFARLRASGKERKDGNRKARYKDPACPDTTNAPVLPDGWTWAAVGQVSRLVQYGSSAKTTEESNGVPVLRMINIMSDGRLNLKDLKYLPPYHKEFPDLLLQTGDLLFNRTNSPELVGKSAVYNGTPSPCSFASYLIRVRTMEGCSPTFLAFCLNSAWGRSWIKSVVSQQVGQANVNGSKLQGFVFPLPPWGEQRRIVAETERRLSVMDELEMQLEANLKRAERLRQAILNRAFEGKLVPQDPNDEPASVLLERIRAERDNRQASPSLKRRRLTEAIRKIRGQHAEPNSL